MTPDSTAQKITALLQAGIAAARRGDKARARQLLRQVTEQDPTQELAWLWLAGVAKTLQDAQTYLEIALALNPDNQQAQEGLRWVQSQLSPKASAAEVTRTCPLCGHPLPADASSCPVCGQAPTSAATDQETPGGEAGPAEVAPAPGFFLSVEQAEAIDACLDRIAYESEARCIILADITGQLIAERGQTDRMNTQVLSALAAGELAATHELARLVGEEARFKLLLHEGQQHSVYLSDVGEQLILVIVFDVSTPIGLVRMILKKAVAELGPIIRQPGPPAATKQVNETLGGDFAQLLETELNVSLNT